MKRNYLVLIVTTLILLSLACSLGAEAVPDSEPDLQIEDTAAPTDPPPATATKAPTFTPIPPTPTNTPEPTEDLLVPRPVDSANPCSNVLYPLVENYQHIYEVVYLNEDGVEETDQIGITVSKIENSEAVVDMLNLTTGIITQSTISCDNGSLVNFPVIMLNFLVGEVEGELDMEHVDGIFAPAYETLMAENWVSTWNSQYLANGMINIEIEGETATATLTDTLIEMDWEIRGEDDMFETVEVPAGVFENALKLYRTTTMDIQLSLSDSDISFSIDAILTLDMVIYYQPNLGMLMQMVESAEVTLLGSTFPISIEGAMLLKEFRDGQ